MKDFQQRVVNEKADLMDKLGKLNAFIGTPAFQELEQRQQDLLSTQSLIMASYCNILELRIQDFDLPQGELEA